MKLNKKALRLALIAAVTAGVCLPCLNLFQNDRARAADGPVPSPTPSPVQVEPPKGPAVAMFAPVDPGKVVITAGDQTVTAGEILTVLASLDAQTQKQIADSPHGKRDLAEHFLRMKLMSAKAKQDKLDQTPLFKAEYDQLLGKSLQYKIQTDNEGNIKFFADNKDWFSGVKARHILIAVKVPGGPIESAKFTDAEAKAKAEEIRQRLIKGEDFVSLARSNSDDRGSAATGGDLGLMHRYQMVAPFEEAAYTLKDGEVSQPVKTQFGYHIIQVLGHTPTTYEEVAQIVPRRRMDAIVEEMKKSLKPVINESFFGPEETNSSTTKPVETPSTTKAAETPK